MNEVDIGIIIIVCVSATIGLMRGITREILGLFSWVGAVVATFFTVPFVKHMLRNHIHNHTIADYLSITLIFVGFLIAFSLISHFLSNSIKESALSGVDRSLGLLFGGFRGGLLLCAMEITISSFVPRAQHANMLKNSRLISSIYQGSDTLWYVLPAKIKLYIEEKRSHIRPAEHQENIQDNSNNDELENKDDTVSALAELKPKAELKPESTRTQAQRNSDMNRLLATLGSDEEQRPAPETSDNEEE